MKDSPAARSHKEASEMLRRMQEGWKDLSDDDWRMITTCYLAQLSFLDHEMGRIVQALKDTG